MAKTNWYSEIPFERRIMSSATHTFAYMTKCPYVGGKYVGAISCMECEFYRNKYVLKKIVKCTHPKNLE